MKTKLIAAAVLLMSSSAALAAFCYARMRHPIEG
jgi:hypothetical protein